MKRLLPLVVLLVACSPIAAPPPSVALPTPTLVTPSQTPPPSSSIPSAQPTATATLLPTSTAPSSSPTASPSSPAPTPTSTPSATNRPPPLTGAKVEITRQFLKAFVGRFNEREYEVITEVHNAGTAPAGISGGDNTYEIFLKDGSSLKSGPFVYAFPPVLEPGEYGYYMEGGELGLSLDVTTVAKVVPHVQYDTTSCDPGAFTVTDVRTYKVLYGSGLSAEGLVTNVGATAAPNLIVGYVFFGAHGNILGGLYDNLAGSLSPGDSVQDMTVFPGTPPILSTKVASTKTFAFDESLLGC